MRRRGRCERPRRRPSRSSRTMGMAPPGTGSILTWSELMVRQAKAIESIDLIAFASISLRGGVSKHVDEWTWTAIVAWRRYFFLRWLVSQHRRTSLPLKRSAFKTTPSLSKKSSPFKHDMVGCCVCLPFKNNPPDQKKPVSRYKNPARLKKKFMGVKGAFLKLSVLHPLFLGVVCLNCELADLFF